MAIKLSEDDSRQKTDCHENDPSLVALRERLVSVVAVIGKFVSHTVSSNSAAIVVGQLGNSPAEYCMVMRIVEWNERSGW